jgi:colanic acid/amylovoran biosynthesis glycosyltransferase
LRLPRTAYILLWFPKPSETFVFREVMNLRKMGLPLKVFSLYGELTESMSEEMRSASKDVERLGLPYLKSVASDIRYWWVRDRRLTASLFRTVPLRRWNGLEKTGENLWAFLCAFRLARRFQEEGIEHIHAPWASGPATAAWIASRLTGIPFTFNSRAWDIYPPDGALKEKVRDAVFVRSETGTNIGYLSRFCGCDISKFRLTYNGVPLTSHRDAPVRMEPPYQFLALGRFVGKKGYDFLLRGCGILADKGVDFRLTMAGDGSLAGRLKALAQKLGIADRVAFPGFVPYDGVSDLIYQSDMLIMPSVVHSSGDRDGIPTVIMESLMHRVPVIATDVSGIAEVIEDGVTGLLIPEKDPAAIADAVLKMVASRESSLAMAETGRAKVLRLFDAETNHRQLLELYQEVPEPSPGSSSA